MDKITIKKSAIEEARSSGMKPDKIAEKLGVSLEEYKHILKVFNIKGKAGVNVKTKYNLVDDSQKVQAEPVVEAAGTV